ncbi:unnamed protein product, partial [Didymodactylos carnosus]
HISKYHNGNISTKDNNEQKENNNDDDDEGMIIDLDEEHGSSFIRLNQNCDEQNSTHVTNEDGVVLFLKRILHFLLTLQSMFFVSETAVSYVALSLCDILEWAVDHVEDLRRCIEYIRKLSNVPSRLTLAENWYSYNPPKSRTITIPQQNSEDLLINYSYVSFTDALRYFLKLPEVQADLNELSKRSSTYPVMLDIHDGEFAQTHSFFKNRDVVKIELSSDGLCITNAISNHVHKIFLFYWSLMNLRRDHRSSQAATRLIVASPEENLSADVLQQITADFVHALQKMGRDGLEVIINGVKKVYHVALFITLWGLSGTTSFTRKKRKRVRLQILSML